MTRRPVVKIDLYGKRLQVYPSVAAAARENFMVPKSIRDRCNRVTIKEMDEGWTFRYLGDEAIGNVRKKLVRCEVDYCEQCGREIVKTKARFCKDCRRGIWSSGAKKRGLSQAGVNAWREIRERH